VVNIEIEYRGGLRCVAKHGPSGAELTTDAPVDNHGKGESFSPTDLVATALGSCMATIMGIFAERHGIDLSGMKIRVSKEMAAAPVRRIAKLTTEIWAPVSPTSPHSAALEKAALGCPVHHSLDASVDKPIVFHWTGK
jgi:uncharacterized OsmC-like protein